MIDIKECTGCGACSAICNHRAISMIPDCKGFLRPYLIKKSVSTVDYAIKCVK